MVVGQDQPDVAIAFRLALTAPMTEPAQPRSTESGAHRNEARDDRAKSPRRPTVDQLSEWSFPASDPPGGWTWEPPEREDPPPEDRELARGGRAPVSAEDPPRRP
jgi:hypothetical protein